MLYLVTGGSGSGKSEFAEGTAVELYRQKVRRQEVYRTAEKNVAEKNIAEKKAVGEKAAEEKAEVGNAEAERTEEECASAGRLIYVATMQPFDEECVKRIERHRQMRKEKGFSTVECYHHLETVQAKKEDVFLIECMSNLLANEMYDVQGRIKGEAQERRLEEAVVQPILALAKKAAHVVVVTNEVFSDGAEYAEESKRYMRLLGRLNRELAEYAERAVEVVYGIPLYRKGE